MKSIRILKFSLIALLIIWVNIQHGLKAVIYKTTFLNNAEGFLKELALAQEAYPKYLFQLTIHGVFLSLLILCFYLLVQKITRTNKWTIIALSVIPLSIIGGYASALIDRNLFDLYFLGFNQGAIKLETLSLFEHLIIRNTLQVFCLAVTVIGIQVIGDFLMAKKKIIAAFRSTTKSYWLINFLIYFVIVYFHFIYSTGSNFTSDYVIYLANTPQFVIMSLILTLFTAIIHPAIYSYGNQKARLSSELFKSLLLIIGVSSFFFLFNSNLLFSFPFGPGFIDIIQSFFQILVAVILIVFGLTYITYRLNIGSIKITLALEDQNRKLGSELSLLKSQINPHFLFNSLNTVYGLALEESSPKSAEGVLKLSEMMRFMLQENTADKIPLEREIKYINDYVDFQKLRIIDQENIELNIELDAGCKGEIAPMLLIPMIENAFKHGISLAKPSWITITLNCNQNEVHLNIQNSMHQKTSRNSEESGIGLENVRQRLKILYPDRHLFQLFEDSEKFEVNMKVNIS